MQMIGHGVYSFLEVARLTRLKRVRIREWFLSRSVFTGDYPAIEGDHAISFLDMIDVLVAGKLRNEGVSLREIRKVYTRMEAEFSPHPFCRKELFTDGKKVFLRYADGRLMEIISRQQVFPKIITPFLRQINYDIFSKLAQRWNIAPGIVIDPEICFGKPVVREVGITTKTLTAAFEGNGRNAGVVAKWYNIHPHDVLRAVKFEGTIAA